MIKKSTKKGTISVKKFLENNKIYFEVFASLLLGLMSVIIAFVALKYQAKENILNENNFEPEIWLEIQNSSVNKSLEDTLSYILHNDGYKAKSIWGISYWTETKYEFYMDTLNKNSLFIAVKQGGSPFFTEQEGSNRFKNIGELLKLKMYNFNLRSKEIVLLIKSEIEKYNIKNKTRIKFAFSRDYHYTAVSYLSYNNKTSNDLFLSESSSDNVKKVDKFKYLESEIYQNKKIIEAASFDYRNMSSRNLKSDKLSIELTQSLIKNIVELYHLKK